MALLPKWPCCGKVTSTPWIAKSRPGSQAQWGRPILESLSLGIMNFLDLLQSLNQTSSYRNTSYLNNRSTHTRVSTVATPPASPQRWRWARDRRHRSCIRYQWHPQALGRVGFNSSIESCSNEQEIIGIAINMYRRINLCLCANVLVMYIIYSHENIPTWYTNIRQIGPLSASMAQPWCKPKPMDTRKSWRLYRYHVNLVNSCQLIMFGLDFLVQIALWISFPFVYLQNRLFSLVGALNDKRFGSLSSKPFFPLTFVIFCATLLLSVWGPLGTNSFVCCSNIAEVLDTSKVVLNAVLKARMPSITGQYPWPGKSSSSQKFFKKSFQECADEYLSSF